MWIENGFAPSPSTQTGQAVLPHPAFQFVVDMSMNWLRHTTQGYRKSWVSRAGMCLAHPGGRFTMGRRRSVQLGFPMHQHAQPCGTMLTLAGEQSFTHPYHVPASLCSTIVTRFFAPTEALTPTGPFATSRGSLIHVT